MANLLNPSVNQIISQTPVGRVLNAFSPQVRAELALDVLPVTGELRSGQRLSELLTTPISTENAIVGNEWNQSAYNRNAMNKGADIGLESMGLAPIGGAIGWLVNRVAKGNVPRMFGQSGIIGGQKAKNADLPALERAQAMKAQGIDADTIYTDTKWWLDHPDGKPRFEIDDSGAKLKNIKTWTDDGYNHGLVNEYVSHKPLFKEYSNIKSNKIFIDDAEVNSFEGAYHPNGAISVTGDLNNLDGAKSTTLHELQHAIQSREGMARGGSPEAMADEYTRARARLNFLENDPEVKRVSDEYSRGVNAILDDAEDYATIQPRIDDFERELIRNYPGFAEQQEILKDLSLIKDDTGYKAYKRLAGESEARLVQDRMSMTMDERLASPFYKGFDVPLDEQIVRMDDGTSLSTKQTGDAGLPMDKVSKDDIKKTKYFHGTGEEIDNLKIPYGGSYLSESPDLSDIYIPSNTGKKPYEFYLDESKILDLTTDSKNKHDAFEMLDYIYDDEDGYAGYEKLSKLVDDGYLIELGRDKQNEIVEFLGKNYDGIKFNDVQTGDPSLDVSTVIFSNKIINKVKNKPR